MMLPKNEDTIGLPGGQELTKQQLYLKAISLGSNHGEVHYRLALTLNKMDDTIKLLNGTTVTQRQLLLFQDHTHLSLLVCCAQ